MFHYNTVEEACEALRNGEIILVTDDEGRENEGDMICAAQFATTENVNFMAAHAKGLICMPMSAELCDRLHLPQMVDYNTDNHCTATMWILPQAYPQRKEASQPVCAWIRTQSPRTSAARDTCSLLQPRKTAFSNVRDTLRLQLTSCV